MRRGMPSEPETATERALGWAYGTHLRTPNWVLRMVDVSEVGNCTALTGPPSHRTDAHAGDRTAPRIRH